MPSDLPSTVNTPLQWNNRFASLGAKFFTRLQPQALPEPYWVSRNQAVARELGQHWFESQAALEALQAFSGNSVLPGSDPLASVYSGHQFGQWAGQLGDGRAILLGELETTGGGLEVQLKGAGRTPYSRGGDGRAVLRSAIREYLCSEAMHGLGIPTTRALCVTGSDAFNHGHICNHSDEQGRYAYNKQPNMAYWNLFCLGQALLPLIKAQDQALAALESYKTVFPEALQARMRLKLGLPDLQSDDAGLIESAFKLLASNKVDYTIFWQRLCAFTPQSGHEPVRDLFFDGESFNAWALQYSERVTHINKGLRADLMLKNNPKFVLRNHLSEEAIRAAKLKDFSKVNTLLNLLQAPFDEHPGHDSDAGFPPDWAAGIEISCSS